MKRLFWLFLLAAVCVSARANATTVKTTPWHPVYIGIDQARGSIDGSDASVAYALRVDLRAPASSSIPHRTRAARILWHPPPARSC